ncbi:ComEC/Rec2-related protein [Belliella baltica DSM 15883]|uniref:ComEC/Rec2-related protein n=1 Tax=Belliella baltica (strain DSM 15883 / CIP 108006 / LMG 21964 / BA134) TaxID=866536 RepID=I3Z1C6_BELBD|nr:ComEC/Rec2 family competence protein [Belliella baltica]AFL83044.1 ComEC/Rec2-related protein [Belliella baltica DSM 15883]
MKFSEFPFLRYVLFFLLGVLLYTKLNLFPLEVLLLILGISYCLYCFLVIRNRIFKIYQFKFFIPFLAYMQLVVLGLVFNYQRDLQNQQDHLIHHQRHGEMYLAAALANDEPKPNSIANRVKLLALKDSVGNIYKNKGEVLIYHKLDESILPGDLLIIGGNPERIPVSQNPKEFDYASFMERQQVTHSQFVNTKVLKVGKIAIQPIEDFFLGLRASIMNGMDQMILDTYANQVAKALLLGQKKNLEKEVNDAYVTAGAMHILAVSGLHVGIIYGFFFLFVKPFRLKLAKRVLYLSIIILLIWSYALLTGLSPSVMRAATMFSIMALAQMKSRSPSIFNAIALSALILLVYDPLLIFAVGFQLSYLALIGILLIQPVLVKLWIPKSKVVEYIWQISTVGIAAQLMTFPISAYYFHVFPSYFILSNLVAIPGAFLIMSFGVPFMIFAQIPFLAKPLAWITEWLIRIVNQLIFSIQELPFAKIEGIFLRPDFMLAYWLILILVLLLVIQPRKWHLYGIASVLLLFGFIGIDKIFKNENSDLMIYSLNKGFSIDYKEKYYFDYEVPESDFNYKVIPNRLASFSREKFPLIAFSDKSDLYIFLPNLEKPIVLKHMNVLEINQSIHNVQVYNQGEWRLQESFLDYKLGDRALKLVFK